MIELSLLLFLLPIYLSANDIQVSVDSLVKSYLNTEDPEEHYDIFSELMLSSADRSSDELNTAIAHLTALSTRQDDKRYLSFGHSLKGDLYFLNAKYDSAAYYYIKQSECLDQGIAESSTRTLMASGYGNAAASLNLLGEKLKAIKYAHKALSIAEMIGELRGEADVHYVLSSAYSGLLQIDSAIDHLKQCYKIDLERNHVRGLIRTQFMIGNLYEEQNKFDLANQTYQKVLSEIPDSLAYRRYKLAGYRYLSSTFSANGEMDSAKLYVDLAIDLSKSEGSKSDLYKAQLQKIGLLVKLGETPLALNLFDDLPQVSNSELQSNEQFHFLKICVGLHIAAKEFDKASNCLHEALDDIHKRNLESKKIVFYPLAIELYEKQRKWRDALEYSKKFTQLTEKFNNDKVEQEVLRVNYENEIKNIENENEIILLEGSLLKSKLTQRKNFTLFFGAIAFLSCISLIYFLRNYKIREKLNKQIQKALLEKKEKQIIEKDMQALRAQMNPHFMFNSLNSINNFIIKENPREASKHLSKFAKLMRLILANSDKKYVQIRSELEAIQLYVDLENIRSEGKYTLELKWDKKLNLEDIYIPPLMLQPFVENSIKHGFKNKKDNCQILMNIQVVNESLIVEIEDNGAGFNQTKSQLEDARHLDRSHSMDITRSRLELISRLDNILTELDVTELKNENSDICGTKVFIRLPIIKNV